MEYDIRKDNDTIDLIRFSENHRLEKTPNGVSINDIDAENYLLVEFEYLNNLLAAIKKAKELWM